jgi:hypothetical protein
VTSTQVYNHLTRLWMLVCKIRNVQGLTFSNESTSIMMDACKLWAHLMVRLRVTTLSLYLFIPFLVGWTNKMSSEAYHSPKGTDLLNKSILNYNQVKTIFDPTHVPNEFLFTLCRLVDAINYLADNKAHGRSHYCRKAYSRQVFSERQNYACH